MLKVTANGISINYEQQGSGEPLVMIPYLTADNACCAFQVPEYSKHFTCISFDPRLAGETDKPEGTFTTELFADDVEAFLQQSDAVLSHNVEQHLGKITAPTQITFDQFDMITSTRFADTMTSVIEDTEMIVFEDCAHAPLYEKTEEFNQKTLAFLQRHSGQEKVGHHQA